MDEEREPYYMYLLLKFSIVNIILHVSVACVTEWNKFWVCFPSRKGIRIHLIWVCMLVYQTSLGVAPAIYTYMYVRLWEALLVWYNLITQCTWKILVLITYVSSCHHSPLSSCIPSLLWAKSHPLDQMVYMYMITLVFLLFFYSYSWHTFCW